MVHGLVDKQEIQVTRVLRWGRTPRHEIATSTSSWLVDGSSWEGIAEASSINGQTSRVAAVVDLTEVCLLSLIAAHAGSQLPGASSSNQLSRSLVSRLRLRRSVVDSAAQVHPNVKR